MGRERVALRRFLNAHRDQAKRLVRVKRRVGLGYRCHLRSNCHRRHRHRRYRRNRRQIGGLKRVHKFPAENNHGCVCLKMCLDLVNLLPFSCTMQDE